MAKEIRSVRLANGGGGIEDKQEGRDDYVSHVHDYTESRFGTRGRVTRKKLLLSRTRLDIRCISPTFFIYDNRVSKPLQTAASSWINGSSW